jgi:hypothetical protein
MAPPAIEGTTFKKNGRSDPGAVMNGESSNFEYCSRGRHSFSACILYAERQFRFIFNSI